MATNLHPDRFPSRAPLYHAELIRGGLQDRVIGRSSAEQDRIWRVVFLQAGQITLEDETSTTPYEPPILIWQPWDDTDRMRIRAGSSCAILTLGELGLANALGRKPEAAEIRAMAFGRVALPLAKDNETLMDVVRAFDLTLREHQKNNIGVELVIEAQLRVLFVILWRHAMQAAEIQDPTPAASRILQQFRQLLELHFRDRWRVAEHADALGMTTDRLHDICTRVLHKPPLRLIHERTVFEAESLLTRSTLTVDQISAFLGFKTPGQFNRFFKTITGKAPGRYRKHMRDKQNDPQEKNAISFADWP